MSLKKLGRYELVRVLGQGAMGVVYEGRDPRLGRRVAIKTVQAQHLSQEIAQAYEARFRTEARSAARLQHPHIVSVYDCARDGDTAFLVMEYIQGRDLKQRLDQGARFTPAQSLRIGRELLFALDYAHRQGIIHRDIKPANLLIESDGRLKLADFGVARIMDAPEATHTQGTLVGTLKYMAPEQVQGLEVDPRADLFATGVVLYQLLTGVRPFEGDNDYSVMQQVVSRMPLRPSALNPKLPAGLDAVLLRALAKAPAERFDTAGEFADALFALSRAGADITETFPLDRTFSGAAQMPPPPPPPDAPDSSLGAAHDELACWKEMDSVDEPHVIENFLARFPASRHADLALRRLRLWHGKARLALRHEQTSTWPTWDGLPTQRAPRWRVITGGCALVLVALVAVGWSGYEPAPALVAEAAAPAPAPASVAPVAAALPAPTAPKLVLAATAPPLQPAALAPPAPARTVVAEAAPAQAPPPAVDRDERAISEVAASRARQQVALRTSTSSPRPVSTSPSATRRSMAQGRASTAVCSGHVLLSRQWCLQRECVKPIFDQAQACKLFRQHARIREESRRFN
ncbi:MAG TPA: serine/threonine-protein kinase [Ramlibacter sp.]|nr:serine/threonine-protein kinase [Ramlibacter sp.]